MVVGIDASNILAGGGLVHLKELLEHAQPNQYNFTKVIVWAPQSTLDQLPDKSWLDKQTHTWLNRNLVFRILWAYFLLPQLLKQKIKVEVLFSPGANAINFHPVVSMCQNLLPFDKKERRLYGWSWMRVRLKLLFYMQRNAFRKASRVIFLTPSSIGYTNINGLNINSKAVVVPHGIHARFGEQLVKEKHTVIEILYVSIVDVYKHQHNVVEAVYSLLDKGYKVELTLVGSSYAPAMRDLERAIAQRPEYINAVKYVNKVPHNDLVSFYQEADIFVFASSCETFSLILLEAMASRLPIACSDRDTLRDTLQDAGVYFDSYQSKDIAKVLANLIDDEPLRFELRKKAYEKACLYSWRTCADLTFRALSQVGAENRINFKG